jgi:hypothetical protein
MGAVGRGLFQRLRARRQRLGLAFLALVAYLLLPLGAMPMGSTGLPGDDICTTAPAPQAGSSPAVPASSHDSPCCAAHCLSCGSGGGLPSAVVPLIPTPWVAEILPSGPTAAELPESHASPFAARAPPSHA